MSCYRPLPVAFESGAGAWLRAEDGRRYLDAVGGLAVCGLGHSHPRVTAALVEQAGRLLHTSNLYRIPLQHRLAARLAGLSGMERAFFCNSGAEANEAAIKLARLYGISVKGMAEPRIVVAEGAFHGRTLGAWSASLRPGFGPLIPGFLQVPYGDSAALERLQARAEVVAVLLEPLQGEGGVRMPPPGYLREVRRICDRQGWLLLLDEVQTGMCRTGRWFAYQHEEILPDVLALAKGLGNGMPIGACLARGAAAKLFAPGSHGSTFGGNPLAMRVALAVLDVLEEERLAARAAALGKRLSARLRDGLGDCPGVREIRGMGLMIGIELDRECRDLSARALQEGMLLNVAAGRVVRLLPPLILTDEEADRIADCVIRLLRSFCSPS